MIRQKNRVTSIPKNHALAQDNSTPTKQPHFTRDSYPLTPPFRETLRIALHLSKHRSWFSIAEYELSVLSRQCLARRVPDQTFRAADVEARRTARNDVGSRFNWQFTTQDARTRYSRFPSTKLKHIARGYLAVIAKLSTSSHGHHAAAPDTGVGTTGAVSGGLPDLAAALSWHQREDNTETPQGHTGASSLFW